VVIFCKGFWWFGGETLLDCHMERSVHRLKSSSLLKIILKECEDYWSPTFTNWFRSNIKPENISRPVRILTIILVIASFGVTVWAVGATT